MELIKIKEACIGGFRDGYINPDNIIYISAGNEPDTTVIETTARNIFIEMNIEEFLKILNRMNVHAILMKA